VEYGGGNVVGSALAFGESVMPEMNKLQFGRKFIRTCQECGHKQEDEMPRVVWSKKQYEAFTDRKCKACGSIGLDYGSLKEDDHDKE